MDDFRFCTSFQYHRVSTDTTFQCAIKDYRPQGWARMLTFQARVRQMTLITIIQNNVVTTFKKGEPIIPKRNSPTSYKTQDVTTEINKLLGSSK